MAEREHLDDRTLVERILEGDRDRFTELVKRYEKRIINYVYRITHRYEDAHDLAQEIFVKVYVALDRYDPKYQFSTWLFRIAQNSAIDALRKKTVNEVSIAPKPGDEDTKEREFADTGCFAVSRPQQQAARGRHRHGGEEPAVRLSRADSAPPLRGAILRGDRFDEEASPRHG